MSVTLVLFALVFFLMGVILFGIGLLGEYIGRIYQQVWARPRYVVQTILEDDAALGARDAIMQEPALAVVPTDKRGVGR